MKKLLKWLVIAVLGYFVFQSGFIQEYILPLFDEEPAVESSVVLETAAEPASDDIDVPLIRETIFQLTNELRLDHGAGELTQNDLLQEAADVRAVESAESFSHTRPDGSEFYTVLDGVYTYLMTGENLAMATYYLDDVGMAEFLFEGWVESQGHYENMIQPDYLEMGVGVYYDGEFLYLVQIFGSSY